MAPLGVAVAALAPSAGTGPDPPPPEAIIARRAFRCLMPHALQSDCTMQNKRYRVMGLQIMAL